MRLLLIAFQFLTIIPLPFRFQCEKEDLGRSTAFFPVAGFALGGVLLLADRLLFFWVARPLCDALLITLLALITGALHLDGLADVCDGLAARGSRERFLAVMKDSQVGAVGAVGLVLGILLKWQALVAVPSELKWQAVLLFPALARFGQVLTLTGARHARQDGLGAVFTQGAGWTPLFLAFATTSSACFYLLGLKGIVVMAAVCIVVIAGRTFFQRKLGGLTGDTIGCISELNEITVLIVISVLPLISL
ncbi:MAG: adenosylcobinamide-GDP ribazoletransferase [Desulfuromonadaceae bacterium]|nr:adenosylcobinamide-GDP ribazoletransferase [Desulfuromonadaceae bacterium]MDD2847432.1 adenosylcobinamide-GDP ribazoletransferase [Desulfuromonadaceae bacterium]MDD4131455.1 adenosylcobinamide-GDP ribazoletransferase [Desulfuromonadaceae bacterium]